MTTECFKRSSSDHRSAYIQAGLIKDHEPVGRWLPDTSDAEEVRLDPLPNKYVRLRDHTGKWYQFASLTPYTQAWVRSHRGRLWRHIKEVGLPTSFVTLTYADDKLDGQTAEKLFSENYNRFMTRLRRYLAKRGLRSPEYIRVLDYGSKHGRLHYHLAFWGLPYIPVSILEEMWDIGYVWIEVPNALRTIARHYPYLRDAKPEQIRLLLEVDEEFAYQVSGLVGYLLKYIVKRPDDTKQRPKGVRAVSYSRGLKPLQSPYKVAKPTESNDLWSYLANLTFDGVIKKPKKYSSDIWFDERADTLEEAFKSVIKGDIMRYGYDDHTSIFTGSQVFNINVGTIYEVPDPVFGWTDFPQLLEDTLDGDDIQKIAYLYSKLLQAEGRNRKLFTQLDALLNKYLRNKDILTSFLELKVVTPSNPVIDLSLWL